MPIRKAGFFQLSGVCEFDINRPGRNLFGLCFWNSTFCYLLVRVFKRSGSVSLCIDGRAI